jgi:thioredoxin 1
VNDNAYTEASLASLIASEAALAVYFSADTCQVCKSLYPRIAQMMQTEYPRFRLLHINLVQHTGLAAQMGVLSVPTLVVYLDHHEVQRYVRQLSVEALRRDLQRPYRLLFDQGGANGVDSP